MTCVGACLICVHLCPSVAQLNGFSVSHFSVLVCFFVPSLQVLCCRQTMPNNLWKYAAPVLVLAGLPLVLKAGEPQPVALAVYPQQVSLSSSRDRQGLIVQAKFADGSTRDVS